MEKIDWEKYIVKINVKILDVDFNNPTNISSIENISGTGFFLSKYIILTCYHVVKYAKDIEIVFNQTNTFNAHIIFICPDDDIALLYVKKDIPDTIHLEYNFVTSKIKSAVYAVGFPMNSNSVIITKGIISGYRNSMIQIDATLNPGNSGGPLVIYNTETNKWNLLGINTSKNSEGENMGFVLPIYRFFILKYNILKKLEVIKLPTIIHKPKWEFKYQLIKQPELRKVLFENSSDDLSKFIKDDIGIRISCLNPEIYLTKYFETNDVLLSINNNNIDINGFLNIQNFPEKIKIKDINLWYGIGDTIKVKILKAKDKKIYTFDLQFEYYEKQLMSYYGIKNLPQYFISNNNLILSIVTNEHIKILPKLNLNISTIVKILNRLTYPNDIFTVYLTELNPDIYDSNKYNKYPLGKIIIELNNKTFHNLEEFLSIVKEPITVFKTIDNDIFYIS